MTSLQPITPPVLLSIVDAINCDARLDTDSSWRLHAEGEWSLQFCARLSVPATEFVPNESSWHMVVMPTANGETAHIYPDAVHGITSTFPHQDYNGKTCPPRPWTLGKPCLEKPIAVFNRTSWSNEPRNLAERLPWLLQRLLKWLDAAASGSLNVAGDPLELPALPGQSLFPLLGFREASGGILQWIPHQARWGYASISQLRGANSTRVITKFERPDGEVIRSMEWPASMLGNGKSCDAVWLVLPEIPVLPPWQVPASWLELSEWLAANHINLGELLVEMGRAVRRNPLKAPPSILLLGFPISEQVGLAPSRMHWFATRSPSLSTKKSRRKGFRSCEHNYRYWDAEIATSKDALEWQRTANWATDQLRTRGAAENEMCRRRVLLIGAGSLGSSVAENLLRMGVCELGILDFDWVMMGNLSRHSLSMHAVGHKKAKALATHLNECMPDAKVRAFDAVFPPNTEQVKQAVRGYDMVVDCTGDDDVLDALASFDWKSEKLFVSLAMTWRAEGLFAYSASESSFPAIDAKSQFASSPSPTMNELDAQIEGIGCWHAVFPATADDVQLWGAIGSKFIRRAVMNPGRRYEYFQQMPDGTIELVK